jgi:hypothetical protein
MDISLDHLKHYQQSRSRATRYPKYIRYSSKNHRNTRKEERSRKQGKLVGSLWFLPVAIIKKLFRVQLSCTTEIEDDLI